MQLDGTGNVKGTGEFLDYPVQAVYRAIGYHGSPLDELEYDARRGVIPNEGGRVLDADGNPVPGIYATGWIKRGPVGLIGHTKGDALETIGFLLEDRLSLPPAQNPDPQAIIDLLEERGIEYTTWEGWNRLDAHELALGAEWSASADANGIVRERIKVVPREDMVRISRRLVPAAVARPAAGRPLWRAAGTPSRLAGHGCHRHAVAPLMWEFNEESGPSGSAGPSRRRGHRGAAPAAMPAPATSSWTLGGS